MNLPVAMPTVRQTVLRSAGVLAVCAAVASFSHIYSFARAAGQTSLIAVLYPGSTDVLVACATACLLHASRNKPLKATFARWAFAVGVAATVAANIGDHFRPIPFAVGAAVSGWPAVSFVLAVVLVHWFWNSGPPVPSVTEASRDERSVTETRYVTSSEASSNGASVTEASRDAPIVTGSTSKTERVLGALQKARARGENPTAAALAEQCAVSPTLARNVVRDSKVASNGDVT